MFAIFRNEVGEIRFDTVANIQYYKNGIWSVMFSDYETQEINGELIETGIEEI